MWAPEPGAHTCEIHQEEHLKRIALFFVLLAATLVFSQQPASPAHATGTEQKQPAVNLLRVINTAEMNYRAQKGRFADFQQLVAANLLDPQSLRIPAAKWPHDFNPANAKEPVPGLALTLSPSPGGDSYQVAVLATKHSDEHWGFYSNQEGIIFEMQPLQ